MERRHYVNSLNPITMRSRLLSIITVAALATSVPEEAAAQDIHFSQFYETSILRNPGLIGLFNGDYKVSANYRNQWNSISHPFVTGQISVEGRIPVDDEIADFFSVGLLANYDKAGALDMKTMSVYPAVSYSKSLEDEHNSYISVGFTGGYLQRSFDPSKMTVNNQYVNGSFNPDNPTGENITDYTLTYWDLGAGVSFSSGGGENSITSYFFGASAYHFTKPKTSFYNNDLVHLEMRWNANAGVNHRINESIGFMAQLNYSSQGKYRELIGGGLVSWKRPSERQSDPLFIFYVGALYRLKDAVIPVVKLDYMRYSFGISYDVNVSGLKAATSLRGGYELSVVKTGLFADPKWQKSRTICPHFFY